MCQYDQDITTIEVNGKEYSAIIIGDENADIPRHLLQGERMLGKIIDGREISSFSWKGVIKDDEKLYIYFEKCNITHIDAIKDLKREKALYIIDELSYGLERSDKEFLNLENGIFPLYRIYIFEDDKVLLLPPDMGDLIAISRLGEMRRRDVLALIKRDSPLGFRLIQEMGELLYLSVTGELPFEREEVRQSGFKEIPLSWFYSELDKKTEGFIDLILDASEKNMRDISGNLKPNKALTWFLSRSSVLVWNLENRSEEESKIKLGESEKIDAFFSKAKKEAERKNFWRVKGTLIILIAAFVIAACGIAGYYLSVFLKPPTTAGMEPEEIIRTFYERQSNLDSTNIDDGIKAEIPQYSEVMNLYITRQTRMAYEQSNPHVIAEDWVNAGKPEIMESAFVYGVILDEIERVDEDTWRAKGTWYTPYAYEKEDDEYMPPEGYEAVFEYEVWEDFDMKWNKRGWYVVTDITIPKYEFKELELIPTFPQRPPQLM